MRGVVIGLCELVVACAALGSCGGATHLDASGDAGEPPMQCTGAATTVTENGAYASGSANDSCARLFSWGEGAPGSACTRPLDCAPTCCACATKGRSALSSWCNHNVCATPEETCCALAGTPTEACGTK